VTVDDRSQSAQSGWGGHTVVLTDFHPFFVSKINYFIMDLMVEESCLIHLRVNLVLLLVQRIVFL